MEDDQVFSLEELESRFEMESLVATGPDAITDWSCECNIKLSL
jgi:hypothetical protein